VVAYPNYLGLVKITGMEHSLLVQVSERSFTAQARRAQIVRAAIETIAELGYGQASFARIAERAGLCCRW
jgi:hypothetical protein